MTYAGTRTILDADSHVMELADFLDDFIDPSQRDQLRRDALEALKPVLDGAMARAEGRRSDRRRRRPGCGRKRATPPTPAAPRNV